VAEEHFLLPMRGPKPYQGPLTNFQTKLSIKIRGIMAN